MAKTEIAKQLARERKAERIKERKEMLAAHEKDRKEFEGKLVAADVFRKKQAQKRMAASLKKFEGAAPDRVTHRLAVIEVFLDETHRMLHDRMEELKISATMYEEGEVLKALADVLLIASKGFRTASDSVKRRAS
jgi:hypothetical protein